MPTYDFECSSCGHLEEVVQPMSAASQKDCPKCKSSSFEKVFLSAPITIVKGEPTTIGQWADKNTKKLGRYEKQAKEIQDEFNNQNMTPEAKDRRAMHKKVNNMDEQQKQKWIMEGD